MKPVVLKRGEQIVAVAPENINERSTQFLWVHILNFISGDRRSVCYAMHADEVSIDLRTIHQIGALACKQLIAAIPVEVEITP